MSETMFHGKAGALELHRGLCLTDEADIAAEYARYGYAGSEARLVYAITVDLDNLTVAEVDGYDRDENWAPGDDHQYADADVIVYTDETIGGNAHTTWRLMSAAALAAVTIGPATDAEKL